MSEFSSLPPDKPSECPTDEWNELFEAITTDDMDMPVNEFTIGYTPVDIENMPVCLVDGDLIIGEKLEDSSFNDENNKTEPEVQEIITLTVDPLPVELSGEVSEIMVVTEHEVPVRIEHEKGNLLANEGNQITGQKSTPTPTRTRKRKRAVDNWKQNIRKRKRQAGEEYINTRGKIQPRKDMKAMTCHSEQKETSRKALSYQYYFEINSARLRVCQEFFLNTLAISKQRIYYFFKKIQTNKTNIPRDQQQGKHSKKVLTEEQKNVVRRHIESFAVFDAHYCRSTSNRSYLERDLSFKKMYNLYLELTETPDLCDRCEEYKHLRSPTQEQKSLYEDHIRRKKMGYAQREADRSRVKGENAETTTCVLTIDLQNTFALLKAYHFLKSRHAGKLESIIQKYSEPGHGNLQEIDSAHSCIERHLRHLEIWSPVTLIRNLLTIPLWWKKKFKVLQMKAEEFLDYGSAASALNYQFRRNAERSENCIKGRRAANQTKKRQGPNEINWEVKAAKNVNLGLSEEKRKALTEMLPQMLESEREFYLAILSKVKAPLAKKDNLGKKKKINNKDKENKEMELRLDDLLRDDVNASTSSEMVDNTTDETFEMSSSSNELQGEDMTESTKIITSTTHSDDIEDPFSSGSSDDYVPSNAFIEDKIICTATLPENVETLRTDTTYKSRDEYVIVSGTRKKGGKRLRAKRHNCYICNKILTNNMARHFELVHGNDIEVAKILAMPIKSKSRRDILENLIKACDFYRNINILTLKEGELILIRRPDANTNYVYEDFSPCTYCLGFMSKKYLWHHIKQCKSKINGSDKDVSRRGPLNESSALMFEILGPKAIESGTALRKGFISRYHELKAFSELMDLELSVRISSKALATLSTKKKCTTQVLPLTNDLIKLSTYLQDEMKILKPLLLQKCSWSDLTAVTLCRIILFNKRRSSEASRMTLNNYSMRPNWSDQGTEEFKNSLPPLETILASRLIVVEIMGKRGRKVPVILTDGMKSCVDTLIATRQKAEISEANPFILARSQVSQSHLRGHDCLKRPTHVVDSKRTGTGTDDIYETSLWYFDLMLFTAEYETGREERHKRLLSQRMCQNIKVVRAQTSEETISDYIEQLSKNLKDVPKKNILNYDETNLMDDPGPSKCIFKRDTKSPERVMNSTKSSISIMFAGTAAGDVFPLMRFVWTSAKEKEEELQVAPGESTHDDLLDIEQASTSNANQSRPRQKRTSKRSTQDSDDESLPGEEFEIESKDRDEERQIAPLDKLISSGDSVVVQFATKKTLKHFIGLVLEEVYGVYQIEFMRKETKNLFVFPDVDDISDIIETNIEKKQHVRKEYVEDKVEIIKTGGGVPDVQTKRSINGSDYVYYESKIVTGMVNDYDCDSSYPVSKNLPTCSYTLTDNEPSVKENQPKYC
ncbi:hypothetical protein NQ314_015426 [Rhamnusium bicolor]|uniref:C2H2-type domain-containing protein n=1 Tax=Rhamnusium bicolor TaxID=1586634 RepID=A0AAV8WZG0_9CUCU|nr:hypothetical protein NQ314_015426 [Rhamnusium bicolor]